MAMIMTAGTAVAEGPTAVAPAPATAAAQTAAPTPTTVSNGSSAFLRIDGPQGMLQGESTDAEHRNWIDLRSIEISPPQVGATGGAGSGKAKFGEFKIIKVVDKASAALRLGFDAGLHYPRAIIHMRKQSAAGGPVYFYRVILSDVYVSADLAGGAGGGSGGPTESVTLNFAKMSVEYTPQKPDGSAGTYKQVPDGYDVRSNIRM
jgi:type VI secretion system secreted protein Hcp